MLTVFVALAAANFENVGSLTEVAMFHRASRTLLLTDAVIFVPQDAPEIVPQPQLSTAGALPWCAPVQCLQVIAFGIFVEIW